MATPALSSWLGSAAARATTTTRRRWEAASAFTTAAAAAPSTTAAPTTTTAGRCHRRRRPSAAAAAASPSPSSPPSDAPAAAPSSAAARALAAAHERYAARDYMPALKLYEAVAARKPPAEDAGETERRAALFGATAVHTAFGDVELAQITLREGVSSAGLDFEAAMTDPNLPELVGATQIVIQLRRFNAQLLQKQAQAAAAGKAPAPAAPAAASSSPRAAPPSLPKPFTFPLNNGGGGKGNLMDRDDLASILGSSKGDRAEVDTTVRGVLQRVALLLLALVGLGAALFYLGLEYMFPKDLP
jgi:hypothetical protein